MATTQKYTTGAEAGGRIRKTEQRQDNIRKKAYNRYHHEKTENAGTWKWEIETTNAKATEQENTWIRWKITKIPFHHRQKEVKQVAYRVTLTKRYICTTKRKKNDQAKIWTIWKNKLHTRQMAHRGSSGRGGKTTERLRWKWQEADMGLPEKATKPTENAEWCNENERWNRMPTPKRNNGEVWRAGGRMLQKAKKPS